MYDGSNFVDPIKRELLLQEEAAIQILSPPLLLSLNFRDLPLQPPNRRDTLWSDRGDLDLQSH